MALQPTQFEGLLYDFEEQEIPTHTFAIDFTAGKVVSMVDGLEAMKQAVFLAMNTDRYRHVIFSWAYGNEISERIGNQPPLVQLQIQRDITNALMQDDRILQVSDFRWTQDPQPGGKSAFLVTCQVHTIYGLLEASRGVVF